MNVIKVVLMGAIGLSLYSNSKKNTTISRTNQEKKILLRLNQGEQQHMINNVFPVALDNEVLFLYELLYTSKTVNDNLELYHEIQRKYNILT